MIVLSIISPAVSVFRKFSLLYDKISFASHEKIFAEKGIKRICDDVLEITAFL